MRLGRTLKGSLETTVERDIAPQRVSGTAKEGKQCPEAANSDSNTAYFYRHT